MNTLASDETFSKLFWSLLTISKYFVKRKNFPHDQILSPFSVGVWRTRKQTQAVPIVHTGKKI